MEEWWPLWLALIGVFLTLLMIDVARLWTLPLSAEREAPRVIAHRQKTEIGVSITNHGSLQLQLEAHDGYPPLCEADQQPVTFPLNPRETSKFRYRLLSNQRGVLNFDGVHCRARTQLGLLRKKTLIPVLNAMGVKRRMNQGEGSNFHQLREFRDGDSFRRIDWKATSRVQKLITREYQQERDQQIVFLLDCSMRMRHTGDGASHLDSALNALVLLAHVALRQGDSTGLMTFGGIERWIPPAKGPKAASRLVNGVFDIEATQETPDYDSAVDSIQHRLKKRALIVLVTNLRNEDGATALNALQRLSKKHVVLIADLREKDLEEALVAPISNINDAVQWISSESYQQERKQRHRLARAQGATLIDALPDQLSATLITEYLAIKNRGRL